MARLALYALALLVAGSLADVNQKTTPKVADPVLLQRQLDLMLLYENVHEPNHLESCEAILKSWSLEKNIQHYSNVTAVKNLLEMMEHSWTLPKAVPFDIHQREHKFEAINLFNVLYSAKDYDTFYKTAVYIREHVNEYLFVYVLNVVILNRKDTQGVFTPHIYEVFPSFFNNGEILNTAQIINTRGHQNIDYYPSTFKWDDNIVIRWNSTIWPYMDSETPLFYFTHDNEMNTLYYNLHIAHPMWLGGDLVTMVKDKRGEWLWFLHKQILTHYYMERLSNGLGEIPELNNEVVKQGYTSGLVYHNGIPFPVRPNYFHLDQPEFLDEIQKINDYEHRVRDAIDMGHVINDDGEHINLRVPEAIDVLGRLIEANVDSPNAHYYKDFISLWKKVLGNSFANGRHHIHQYVPLVVPSVLENYQTALRDPAFYMIWKRVLGLFQQWQEQLPLYKSEDLALPQVVIQNVEVDKMLTYFENTYMNVTNHFNSNEEQAKGISPKMSVLVQHPVLNHKVFKIKVHVKSEVAKKVSVKFFLAPKYDSQGHEIPLHINSQNVYIFDHFVYDLPAGDHVITRSSNDNLNLGKGWTSTHQIYENVLKAQEGKEQFVVDQIADKIKWPQRLLLPRGRVEGMPFVLMVYISEYHKPGVSYGTGFDPTTSLGIGTGAHRITSDPLGFPFNRPVYSWQVQDLRNLLIQDVLIYHKHTPEINVPRVD